MMLLMISSIIHSSRTLGNVLDIVHIVQIFQMFPCPRTYVFFLDVTAKHMVFFLQEFYFVGIGITFSVENKTECEKYEFI